jgi:uncharacterized protein (TIRG00374 family)
MMTRPVVEQSRAHAVARKRVVRGAATIVVTGICAAYVIWKIDIGQTAEILADASIGYFLGAVAVMVLTTVPMAWRWQLLLRARGVTERVGWLTRAYFVSLAAGHVLPTSIGGDAVRIYETARRHPGYVALVAASVVLDRAIAGVSTVILAGFGFVLGIGRYDVGAYLWIELSLAVAAVLGAFALFSGRLRRQFPRVTPLLARVRLARPLRALYEAIHTYRAHASLLLLLVPFTVVLQATRVFAIWLAAEAVGINLSLQVYYVMGPLLTLILLFPFTLNGLAVREAFFVSFLGNLAVGADAAFAAGFLFFLVAVATALPGAFILAWEGARAVWRPHPRER